MWSSGRFFLPFLHRGRCRSRTWRNAASLCHFSSQSALHWSSCDKLVTVPLLSHPLVLFKVRQHPPPLPCPAPCSRPLAAQWGLWNGRDGGATSWNVFCFCCCLIDWPCSGGKHRLLQGCKDKTLPGCHWSSSDLGHTGYDRWLVMFQQVLFTSLSPAYFYHASGLSYLWSIMWLHCRSPVGMPCLSAKPPLTCWSVSPDLSPKWPWALVWMTGS